MINKLLNDPYFETRLILKKDWKINFDSEQIEWSDAVYRNIGHKLDYFVVFYDGENKIDTNEKFIQFLNKVNLEEFEHYLLDKIFFRKFYPSTHHAFETFEEMTLFEKCEELGFQTYLSYRNIQTLLDLCGKVYNYG